MWAAYGPGRGCDEARQVAQPPAASQRPVNRYRQRVRLGVLDVGSNTVHHLVVDAHEGAAPLPAYKNSIPLRLAEHLGAGGRIDDDAIDVLASYIRDCTRVSEDLGVTESMAFATSAIREAPNGDDVVASVHARTGVALEVLTGEEEARLTFLAVRRWFGWSAGRILMMDIGGGSLEVAAGGDEEPDVAISLPLGAGRLTRERLIGDPPDPDAFRALRRDIRVEVAAVAGQVLRSGAPSIAVATSKTFRQLARIAGAAPSSEGPHVRRSLRRDDLTEWVAKIATMSESERAALPGVSQGRAAQLPAGACVAEAVMDLLGVDEVQICPWALREGMILRWIDRLHR